jgi:hypothetical protein
MYADKADDAVNKAICLKANWYNDITREKR